MYQDMEEKREGVPDRRNVLSKGAQAGTTKLHSGNNNRGTWLVPEFTLESNGKARLQSQGEAA